MFVHETHNFFIMATMKTFEGAPADYLERKLGYFSKALANSGAEPVGSHPNVWMLNEVMYSSAGDVFDIIEGEVVRIASSDKSIPADQKGIYHLSPRYDKILVSEYIQDNMYVK